MTTAESRLDAINAAIRRGNGIMSFARALGVTHQAVTSWRKARRVPLARAFEISRLYAVPAADIMAPEDAVNYRLASDSESAADVL